MANDLHKLIYEVKGTVNWLSSARIATQGNHSSPGALRLTRLVDTFYIQCNFDGLKTKSKMHKVDLNSVTGAKLMARDGALTVLIPVMGGSIRFVLQKGIESEIEQFIHHLNEIKARVMEKAVSYNAKFAQYPGPIERVQMLYGSKEASAVPALVLRGPASERMDSQRETRTQDDLEKENINVFIDSPEKMRSPEKPSKLWSTFGTPRKRTSLKENKRLSTPPSSLPDVSPDVSPDLLPEVVYWDTKLTNREVFRMSRAVAVDWDSLAGLMDISYPEQEAIRFNDVNYPDYWSRAQAVFALFNASEFFDRRLLQKYFGELGRNDLKKEMLDFAGYESVTEYVETQASKSEISELQLQNTPLSPREICKLGRRIGVDWERLACLVGIDEAERRDIRCNLHYRDARSRAEKILAMFNNMEGFSRETLTQHLKEMQLLDLIKPVIKGEWRTMNE